MPDEIDHIETKQDGTNYLDSFENYFQNAIASMANVRTFAAPGLVSELAEINPNEIEKNNNLSEGKGKIEMLKKSSKTDKRA